MWWHDLSLSAIQSKREWSAPSAETKTAMKRETKEHNSSGFNINLNFAQGNILCIYLHAQRQKRCVEHGGAEAENSSLNSPPTPMKKDCKGSVIPRGGGTSPTDNNPQGQRLAASKSVILFDVENMSLTITASVHVNPRLSIQAVMQYLLPLPALWRSCEVLSGYSGFLLKTFGYRFHLNELETCPGCLPSRLYHPKAAWTGSSNITLICWDSYLAHASQTPSNNLLGLSLSFL